MRRLSHLVVKRDRFRRRRFIRSHDTRLGYLGSRCGAADIGHVLISRLIQHRFEAFGIGDGKATEQQGAVIDQLGVQLCAMVGHPLLKSRLFTGHGGIRRKNDQRKITAIDLFLLRYLAND